MSLPLGSCPKALIGGFFAPFCVAWAALNGACSSIYQPEKATGCQVNADCAEGQVCALDQGGACIPDRPPQRAALGFAIRSSAPAPGEDSNPLIPDSRPPIEIRYELLGCELPPPAPFTAILQIDMRKNLRPLRLSHLTFHRLYSAFCNSSCEEAERCATQPPTCSAVQDATMRLSAPSKLGLGDVRLQLDPPFQAAPREQWEPSMANVPLYWPCDGAAIQVEQSDSRLLLAAPSKAEDPPKTEATAPHFHWLQPPRCEQAPMSWSKATTYGLAEIESCRYRLGIGLSPRDPEQLASAGAEIPRFDLRLRHRYATQLALKRSIIVPNEERLENDQSPQSSGSDISCQSNFECQSSALGALSVCGSDRYCGYSLEDKDAGHLSKVEAQRHDMPVEGYCKIGGNSQKSVDGEQPRSYSLEIAPNPQTPRSDQWLHFGRVQIPLDLRLRAEAGPELGLVASPRELKACLPLWSVRNRQASVELRGSGDTPLHVGSSVELLPGIQCCSAQCLSSELSPKTAVDCELLDSIDLKHSWELDDKTRERWKQGECFLPPKNDELRDNIRGEFWVQAKCSNAQVDTPKGCFVGNWENSDDAPGQCRSFVASVERPPNSVFASFREPIATAMCKTDPQGAGDEFKQSIIINNALRLRPVIRGRVLDAAAEGTSSHSDDKKSKRNQTPLEVVVMAERLREPGEGDVLGPFFFSQKVRAEGAMRGQFALPVEPGRYVLTALPLAGQLGGPTRFSVVDMRPGMPGAAPLTVDERGLMATSVDDPATQLALGEAIPVRVRVQTLKDATDTRVVPYDMGSWKSAIPDTAQPRIPDLNNPRTCYPLDRGCRIRTLNPPTRDATGFPLGFGSVLRFRSRFGGPRCEGEI